MRAVKISLSIIGLQFFVLAGSVSAATPAGTASLVAGSVSAIGLNGEARKLSRDDAVYSGDRILTGSGSYVRMGFVDGSSMMLRPNTEFAIESFRFSPDVVDTAVKVVPPKADAPVAVPALQIADQGSVGNQSFFRLVRGGFRAVSGLVGRINREEYLVRTPVATMGIRGTVFWSVFCDAVCAADPGLLGPLDVPR